MGLLDYFNNMGPDQGQGLLSAGINMMAASGPSRQPSNFGTAALAGLQGYQGTMADLQKRKRQEEEDKLMQQYKAMQMAEMQQQITAREAAQKRAAGLDNIYANFGKGGGPPPGAPQDGLQQPQLGSMPQQSIPGMPQPPMAPPPQQQGGGPDLGTFEGRMMLAKTLRAAGFREQAKAEEEAALKLRAEFDQTPRVGNDANGNPVMFVLDKQGNRRNIDGVVPREEMKLANLQDRFEAYNPFATKPGQTMKMGVDPDTVYSGRVTMRGQNMTDARQREANSNGRDLMNQQRQLRIDEMTGKAEDRISAKQAAAASIATQIGVIDKALAHPGRSTATGLSGTLDPRNYVPGTNAMDFKAVADQVGGAAFLQAFESLKGAGQITEIEGKKATDAIARLSRAQSDSEYVQSLTDLRDVMKNGLNKFNKYKVQSPPAAATPTVKFLGFE